MDEFLASVASVVGSEQFFDPDDFSKLVSRLFLNLLVTTLVIRGLYSRLYVHRDYVFTYYLFNIITFTMCFLLRKVDIDLGFALGLFAVFGILRYRTEPIRIRDLTYLFIVIGIAILNAVANKKVSFVELLAVNAVVVGTAVLLEWAPIAGRETSQQVTYDNMELLKNPDRTALLADLSERTGLSVTRIQIDHIDLLRDVAKLTLYYKKS